MSSITWFRDFPCRFAKASMRCHSEGRSPMPMAFLGSNVVDFTIAQENYHVAQELARGSGKIVRNFLVRCRCG